MFYYANILLFLKYFIYLFLDIWGVLCSYLQTHQKRASDPIRDGYEPPCSCQELQPQLGLLEEQLVLLTTEPSLQPLKYLSVQKYVEETSRWFLPSSLRSLLQHKAGLRCRGPSVCLPVLGSCAFHAGITRVWPPLPEVVLGIKLSSGAPQSPCRLSQCLCCLMMSTEAVPPHLHLGKIWENINNNFLNVWWKFNVFIRSDSQNFVLEFVLVPMSF